MRTTGVSTRQVVKQTVLCSLIGLAACQGFWGIWAAVQIWWDWALPYLSSRQSLLMLRNRTHSTRFGLREEWGGKTIFNEAALKFNFWNTPCNGICLLSLALTVIRSSISRCREVRTSITHWHENLAVPKKGSLVWRGIGRRKSSATEQQDFLYMSRQTQPQANGCKQLTVSFLWNILSAFK